MSTTIYLDVDGVINAIGHRHPEPKHTGFPEYKSVRCNGYQIAYAPELITMLNALAERDDVTIKWLTTWEHDAAKVLSPIIGLEGQEWEVLTGDLHAWRGRDWWKLVAIRADVEAAKPGHAIWIDDDLSLERTAMNWANNHGVTMISPFAKYGLTTEDLAKITSIADRNEVTV